VELAAPTWNKNGVPKTSPQALTLFTVITISAD